MTTNQASITPENHPVPGYIPQHRGVMMVAGNKEKNQKYIIVAATMEELREAWSELSGNILDEKRTACVVVVPWQAHDAAHTVKWKAHTRRNPKL